MTVTDKKVNNDTLCCFQCARLPYMDTSNEHDVSSEIMPEVVEQEDVFTVPNLLSVMRILMSPYIGYLIVQDDLKLALISLGVAGLTDTLDGWIARTFKGQSSRLGSFLDPLADKVLITTTFLTLTYSGLLPVPLTVLVVTRDVLLLSAGLYIRYTSLPPPRSLPRLLDLSHATAQLSPTLISKVNTAVQLITVALTLAAPTFHLKQDLIFGLWCLSATTTVVSGVSYVFAKNTYQVVEKKEKAKRKKESRK